MTTLEILRKEIDAIDETLVAQLGRRFAVVREVAALKRERGIPAVLPERIEAVKTRCMALGAECALDRDLVATLYDLIINAACRLEEDLMRTDTG